MTVAVPGPVQLTKRVWLWPSDPDSLRVQSAVGVIVGDQGTILVDAGNSPEHASRIQEWVHASGFPPIHAIVLTHHHWDHAFGACALDVPVIAHAGCRIALQAEAAKSWLPSALREEIRHSPRLGPSHRAKLRAIRDWKTFRVILPHTVFETTYTLDPGGCSIELEHVGGQHAADSIVVRIPGDRLMFLGDCFYPPPYHLRKPDAAPDRSMLALLLSPAYDLYVEGHGAPRSRRSLQQWAEDRGGT